MEEDLNTDVMVLQSHLDSMLDLMHSNNITLRRFQMFEIGLLNLNSLAEMLEFVLDSQDLFDLDYIGFCLIDVKKELRNFLIEDGFEVDAKPRLIIFNNLEIMKSIFRAPEKPYIGAYKPKKYAAFFADKQPPASISVIPLIRKGQFLGALCLGSLDPKRFVNTMSTDFIQHTALVLGVCMENHLSYEAMKRTSLIDTLTGVNNRRFLEQRLDEEVDRAQRSLEALSCFFFDIDYFKKINDTYGHPLGDQVLIAVADIIRQQLRNNDVLVRYGGEEFIALLANIEEAMAIDIADRIREKIKNMVVKTDTPPVSVTISIGIVTYKPSHGMRLKSAKIGTELIKKADEALYTAKNTGRDKVVSAGIIPNKLKLANLA